MFECCDNYEWEIGFNPNPARQTLAACGYDPDCYISTAQIAPSPYTSQGLIQAKLGGLIKLIEACDDSQPPLGDFSGDVLAVYNNVIQNVITEINGYLSSIYPLPLVQTNTISVIKVTGVTTDGLGTVTSIETVEPGNYLSAPANGMGANLIVGNPNYGNPVATYVLNGLTAGNAYLFTPGANETGALLNGTVTTNGTVYFIAAATSVTIYGLAAATAVTASLVSVVVNSPAYLRHIDPLCNEHYWGQWWQSCQQGTGLELAVTYAATPFSDENGSTVNAQAVSGTPAIVSGGANYNCGDLLVLTGGQSFVPAKIREAALILICHSFYQRRLAPDEKNIFDTLAKMWREKLTSIGNGMDEQLDGTYKRFFSIGAVWGQKSVLFGANSL